MMLLLRAKQANRLCLFFDKLSTPLLVPDLALYLGRAAPPALHRRLTGRDAWHWLVFDQSCGGRASGAALSTAAWMTLQGYRLTHRSDFFACLYTVFAFYGIVHVRGR